ncbi:hypothetical protein ABZ401_19095 [Streptomyces sp. NPDC005892]|uniref:hypothetical protein n=1 Tax=Streptomyces sp. NPDC005892 TaxID=3155593 RepID=UPI00340D58C6
MPTPTTPAATLRAAAAKLRATCSAAAPGPWTIASVPPYTDPLLMSRYEETPDDGEVLIVGSVDVDESEQAHIALMHPGVGLALADWLDAAAVAHDAAVTGAAGVWTDPGDAAERDAWVAKQTDQHALTVARRILGEDEAQQPVAAVPAAHLPAGTNAEDCPAPETHNAGCGCPSDVAAAYASCLGYEVTPSPCRCPCYGCKHHCSAHQPAATEEPTR